MNSINIKNRLELVKNLQKDAQKRRNDLFKITEFVLNAVQPHRLIKKSLFPNTKKYKHIYVIAIGKAAKSMAMAVKKIFSRRIKNILLADSGHPLPTQTSVRNTKRIVNFAHTTTEQDLVIVLISGGGSAMLELPVPGITLTNLITTTSLLLKCGATIQEMNIVRKHLSQVKGGQLAKLLYPSRVIGLIISDVVGNDRSTIASGPLTPDVSTFQDALNILKKYKLLKKVPKKVLNYLNISEHETPKSGASYFRTTTTKIIADHSLVVQKAMEKGKKLGYTVIELTSRLTGEARHKGYLFVQHARQWPTRKAKLYIAAGETTVTVKGKGAGGRNQEFVLSGLRTINPHMTVLSIGTDGIDGICPEQIAGAIGDIHNKTSFIARYLANNDAYHYFKKHGGLIKTGGTGTNLGDLVIIAS